MDLFTNLLADSAGDAINALTGAGFSTSQAAQFLPAIADQVGESAGGLGGLDIGGLLANIDIVAVAEKVGISPSMAQQGLQTIVPLLTSKLDLGSGDGLLAAARTLF